MPIVSSRLDCCMSNGRTYIKVIHTRLLGNRKCVHMMGICYSGTLSVTSIYGWLAGTFRCEFSKESTRATLMRPGTKGFDISRSNPEQPPCPRPAPPRAGPMCGDSCALNHSRFIRSVLSGFRSEHYLNHNLLEPVDLAQPTHMLTQDTANNFE